MPGDVESARAAFFEGVAHFEAGRYERAEERFLDALARVPGRVSTLLNLGSARLKLGRPAEALEVLEQAVAIDAGDAEAWSHRGIALADLGRTDEARRQPLACARDRCLPARSTCFIAASPATCSAATPEALRDFAAVLALRPDDGEAWFRHGQTLQLLDRHAEALTSYEKALAV